MKVNLQNSLINSINIHVFVLFILQLIIISIVKICNRIELSTTTKERNHCCVIYEVFHEFSKKKENFE